MRKVVISVIFFTFCLISQSSYARQPVIVEILFMNHGPMQPVIEDVKKILANHEGQVNAFWHDFDTQAGQEFMRQKRVSGHIPILIFIQGDPKYLLEGREILFKGFPQGAGPYQFRGKWSIQDLDQVLRDLIESQ